MEMNQIKIKIYLKSKKRPICFILDKEEQIDKIIEELSMNDIVKLGNVAFKSEDFKIMKIF